MDDSRPTVHQPRLVQQGAIDFAPASSSALSGAPSPKPRDPHDPKPAAIVFHEAVSARDVLLLIKPRSD